MTGFQVLLLSASVFGLLVAGALLWMHIHLKGIWRGTDAHHRRRVQTTISFEDRRKPNQEETP